MVVMLGTAGAVRAEGDIVFPPPPTDADYRPVDIAEARLGQLLFYDPILSGNRVVACATCHHPQFGTGDGLSLGLGDGGIGLGPTRHADPQNWPDARVPRNAQPLFNLGAKEFRILFHDGRIAEDPTRPGGLRTPLDEDMVTGFDSILAAQAMFPVLSADEMAGQFGENDVSAAVRKGVLTGPGGAWDIIARRVAAIPAYAQDFAAVYDDVKSPDDITFANIANAIAAFIEFEWRADQSPFDAFLRGSAPLAPDALEGATLFYGAAGCADCHSGPFQTDQQFHATGQMQVGPGKIHAFEAHHRDEGRFGVTGRTEDLYAFRTPSLRNVMLTGPYGHAGAFSDLRAFLAAHGDASLPYDPAQVVLPKLDVNDWAILDDQAEADAILAANQMPPRAFSAAQIDLLVAFLESLTDPNSPVGKLGVPETLPSGLPVPADRP